MGWSGIASLVPLFQELLHAINFFDLLCTAGLYLLISPFYFPGSLSYNPLQFLSHFKVTALFLEILDYCLP